MASSTPPGSVFSVSDFFGADSEGAEKFKTVALRALYDQKTEEEVRRMRVENGRFREEREELSAQVQELRTTMAINIDDRERVLAFKSKRIEELQNKVKDYEAVNASLLQTINSSPELSDVGKNTAASIAILQRGEPLFHAVETCKEQDYKRLWEDKKLQCEQLQQHIADNETLIQEMQAFQRHKHDLESQIHGLQAMVTAVTRDKDEKIHFLERKLVFEHDRLTKEKDSEILAHQNDMEKQLRLQLDATTQQTVHENVRVQLELRYQSAQLEKLIKQVDALTSSNRQSTHEKQLVEQMNATLSKKIKFYEQLFARMQHHDQLKTKSYQQQQQQQQQQQRPHQQPQEQSASSPTKRRKPPLPSLAFGSGMRSAFTLHATSSSSSPPCAPPSSSTSHVVRDEENEDRNDSDTEHLRLDMAAIESLGDQLNSVATELDSHMVKREFARKEMNAMVQYHQDSPRYCTDDFSPPPLTNTRMIASPTKKTTKHSHKKMLPKAEYSPASYAPRGARRFREAPLTLDAFIKDHATLSLRNRSEQIRELGFSTTPDPSADFLSRLPSISTPTRSSPTHSPLAPHRPPRRAEQVQSLWKTPPVPSPTDHNLLVEEEPHPHTARF